MPTKDNNTNSQFLNQKKNKAKWYVIEKSMISSKLCFLFVCGKESCYNSYMMLFLTSVGLSPSQAGFVNGVRFIGAMIGAPIMSLVADKNKAHGKIIILITIFSISLQLFQPFIPLLFQENTKVSLTSMNTTFNLLKDGNNQSNRNLFYVMLALNSAHMFFDANFMSFTDSVVLKRVNLSTDHEFGKQRYFGAVGSGLISILSGVFITYFPHNGLISHYSPIFFMYAVMIFSLSISWFMTYRVIKKKSVQEKKPKRKIETKSLLWQHVKKPNNLFFFSVVLFLGTSRSFYLSFFSLQLKELKGPDVLVGISVAVASLSSAIFIRYAPDIMKFLGSVWMTLALGTFSCGVRFIAFHLMTNPWFALIIQLVCHGPGIGLTVISFILHTKQISPEPILTSMCSVSNMLFFSFGYVLANVFGGIVIEVYELKTIWLFLGIVCIAWSCVIIAFRFCFASNTINESDDLNEELT